MKCLFHGCNNEAAGLGTICLYHAGPMKIDHIYTSDSVLEEADQLVSVDRQKDYGHPYDDYTKVAAIATVIFGFPVTAEQCAMFMIGVKMSRQLNKHKRDNLVDMAGYVKVLQMIIQRREELDATKD